MWRGRCKNPDGGKEKRDWTKYKTDSKKRKLKEASKESANIENMFKKYMHKKTFNGVKDVPVEKNTNKIESKEAGYIDAPSHARCEADINNNAESQPNMTSFDNFNYDTLTGADKDGKKLTLTKLPSPLPFFSNGCHNIEKIGRTNFTCATDTVYSVIEAVLIATFGTPCPWHDESDLILSQAIAILNYRLENNFHWNHSIRDPFWDALCNAFPAEFTPKGTINAAVDKAIDHIASKSPMQVVFTGKCSKCDEDIGWFKYRFEEPLSVSTVNLKTVPNSLAELCLVLIERHAQRLVGAGAKRVKCNKCSNWGAVIQPLSFSNLLLPPVITLGFGISTRGYQNICCSVEEQINFGGEDYDLTAAVISQPNHFIAISKLQGKFFNLDNLDPSLGKKAFSSFKAALIENEVPVGEMIVLNKRSPMCRRAGAIQYTVYVGQREVAGSVYNEVAQKAVDVNALLVITGKVKTDVTDSTSKVYCDAGSDDDDMNAKVDNEEIFVAQMGDANKVVEEATICEEIKVNEDINDEFGDVKDDVFEKGESKQKVDITDASDESVEDEREIHCDSESDIEQLNSAMDESEGGYYDNLNRFDHQNAQIDLRLRTFQDIGRLCKLYPGAYFDHNNNGWFCRICQAFSTRTTNRWVSGGVRVGNHPTRKMVKHFGSDLHQKSVQAEKMLKKVSVFKLLQEQGMDLLTKKKNENRNILKAMFTVALYMVKNCLPNDSFENMLKLAGEVGAIELSKYIAECPKNATYLSHHSYKEILDVMNDFIEEPMLEALKKQEAFTIFIDETTAVGNKSMANVYVLFDDGREIKEHYIGLINMNQYFGLTANDFYNAIVKLCRDKGISLTNCAFSEMDGCSTNQGRHKGLKQYFSYHNPHHISESCGSHKLALLPKKLVVESNYHPLQEADKLAVGLAVFFKSSSIKTAVFENTQIVLENKVLKLVKPCPTRWLTHGRCFSRIIDLFLPTLVALNALYTDRDDFQALGFMLGMIDPSFQLSCLALHDVFGVMKLLTNWLQASPSNSDITLVPVLVRKTVNQLLYIAGDDSKKDSMCKEDIENLKFTYTVFDKLSSQVNEFVKSTPSAASTRKRANETSDKKAIFDDYRDEIFQPFAREMAENIEDSLQIHPVCQAFSCLDSRNFPVGEELATYGRDNLAELIGWFGRSGQGIFPIDTEENPGVLTADPKIVAAETEIEYETYKEYITQLKLKIDKESKKNINETERKLMKIKKNRHASRDRKKIESLENDIKAQKNKELTLGDIYKEFRKPEVENMMPNIKKLLLLANLSPIGNAVVERLFSLMKLTKTLLRERLGDMKLDKLLRLNKEAPGHWSEQEKDDLVNRWILNRENAGRSFRWDL